MAEAYVKLVDVEVQRLNIPERDFTGLKISLHLQRPKYTLFLEIKFATKVARIMAFTLTKMRDQIIGHVNRQADKIQSFKEDMINKLVTYDCLQVKLEIRNICTWHSYRKVPRKVASTPAVKHLPIKILQVVDSPTVMVEFHPWCAQKLKPF